MSPRPDIVWLGSTTLNVVNGLPAIRAFLPLTDPIIDKEEFGEVPSFQALGITSMPFPPDPLTGHAEGVILRDCGGRDGAIVGARDARCCGVYAHLNPGDTVLHAVDPTAKAQVRCLANRQLALVTEDTKKQTMMALLDGKNDRVQFAAFGGIVEMSPDNGILLVTPDGKASVQMKNGMIRAVGDVAVVPALCSLGTTELGVQAPGDSAADFVTVKTLVEQRFKDVATAINGAAVAAGDGGLTLRNNIIAALTTAGWTGGTVPPTTAATKVKAV